MSVLVNIVRKHFRLFILVLQTGEDKNIGRHLKINSLRLFKAFRKWSMNNP